MNRKNKSIKININNKKKSMYIRRAIFVLIILIILLIIRFGIGSITYSGKYKQTMQSLEKETSKEYGDTKTASMTEEYNGVKIKYVYPELENIQALNMIRNQMKVEAYETVDAFPEDEKERSLAMIYKGSSITENILAYSIEQKIYVKKGSNIELESDINEPQSIVDSKTGDIDDISAIFLNGIDPMPSIKQETKNAIIETKKIDFEKIGSIGSWKYPEDLIGSGIKISDKGLVVPVNDPDKNIKSVTIPMDNLASVIKPQFLSEKLREEIGQNDKERENGKKVVALSFNDTSSKEDISKLLTVLNNGKAKATLYVLGENIEQNSDVIKKYSEGGHEIGNRSWSHKNMVEIENKAIYQEVLKTDYAIFNQIGKTPNTFRPPYASIDSKSAKAVNHPIAVWSLDSGDGVTKDSNKIYRNVVDNVKSGDIVLFHGTEKAGVDAVKKIIDKLKKENYEFVTVTELMNYRIYPDIAYHSTSTIVNFNDEE